MKCRVCRGPAVIDIRADGVATPAPDRAPTPAEGATWRWLHFDRETEHLAGWFAAHLPPLAVPPCNGVVP